MRLGLLFGFASAVSVNVIKSYSLISLSKFHSCVLRSKQRKVSSSPTAVKVKAPCVTVTHNMTVAELASALGKDTDHVYKCLEYIDNGCQYDRSDSVISDLDVIISVVRLSGFRHLLGYHKTEAAPKPSKDLLPRPPPDPSVLVRRPPVVTIMGHVDHGKTTLLDAIRNSRIVDHEFGGITQHIGAFSVEVSEGRKITFIDTPGHAAFTAMRERGSLITDIVVLVVAADDGVMPQTIESIRHAQNADVPIIVAINKIDKPKIDTSKVKQELLNYGVQLEELGGDVIGVDISALKRLNLGALLESILTIADLNNVRGDPHGAAEGTIIDSKIDKQLGIISSIIVQRGCLRKGALLVSDLAYCKVRKILDYFSNELIMAELSQPVQVVGWKKLPHAGDKVLEASNERVAKDAIAWRTKVKKQEKMDIDYKIIERKQNEHLEEYRKRLELKRQTGKMYKKTSQPFQITVKTSNKPVLPVVLKGDVDGSLDAIINAITSFYSDLCAIEIVYSGIGDVTDADIEKAVAFNGIVYGFNVSIHPTAEMNAHLSCVKIYNIIYRLFEDMRKEMSERTLPVETEEILGEAIVLQEFTIDDKKKKEMHVAGCRCLSGTMNKLHLFKLIRNNEVIHRDRLYSMKHLKDSVQTVNKGTEFGLAFEDSSIRFFKDDKIFCYKLVSSKPTVEWDFYFDKFHEMKK